MEHIWVHVLDSDIHRYSTMQDPELALEFGMLPEIHINQSENPQRLDFRCVVGVTVHLIGSDKARTIAIMRQILRYKPLRVIASGFDETIDSLEIKHEFAQIAVAAA